MRFSRKSMNVANGVSCIFVALGALFTGGYKIADSFRNDLDSRLHTTSSKIVSGSDKLEASYHSDYNTASDLIDANKGLAERIEAEGLALLKNENDALPLTSSSPKVTLFGSQSYNFRHGGTVNAKPDDKQVVNLEDSFNEHGLNVNHKMFKFYSKKANNYPRSQASSTYQGTTIGEMPISVLTNDSTYESVAATFKDYSDAAIIVLGRDSGEGEDYYPGEKGLGNPKEFTKSKTKNIFSLSDDERDLIDYVKSRSEFKHIVIMLNTIQTMEIDELKNDSAIDAIMWVGMTGSFGPGGIADVITGKISPSGSLPDTYAVNTAKAPSAQNYGLFTYTNANELDPSLASGTNKLMNSWYYAQLEGIYTGYKYYETRYYDSIVNPSSKANSTTGSSTDTGWDYSNEVSYSFGYGLSYANFSEEITDVNFDEEGNVSVSVKVKNTSDKDIKAKHTVQLYVSVPYKKGDVEKSAIQLIGYAKTGDKKESDENLSYSQAVYLGKGEEETVTITVPNYYYASYDENEGDGAYILDNGTYYFSIGNGAHEAVNNVLKAQGYSVEGDSNHAVSKELKNKVVIDKTVNDKTIKNCLKQDSDLKSYGIDITYLSRNDYESTFPTTLSSLTANEAMAKKLANYSYDINNYNLADYPTKTFGTKGVNGEVKISDLVGLDYNDPKFEQAISAIPLETLVSQMSKGFQIIPSISEISCPTVHSNGVTIGILSNISAYCEKNYTYYLDPSDENRSFACYNLPLEAVVAGTFSHRIAELEGSMIGNQSLWTGQQWWYGIGGNLHRSNYNARNHDYYSEDSILGGDMALDVSTNCRKYGTIVGMKHIAWNTTETHRTGVSTFFNEQSGRENELRTFQFAVEKGNIGSLMMAYNRVGCTFSAACKGFVTDLIRGEWNYNGICITDLVQSVNNYVTPCEVFTAGTDFIMSSNNSYSDFTADIISKDSVLQNAVYESAHHYLYQVANSNAISKNAGDITYARNYPWWEITIIAGIAVSWTIAAISLGFGIFVSLRKDKESN